MVGISVDSGYQRSENARSENRRGAHPSTRNQFSLPPPIVRETGFKPVLLFLNLEELNNFLSNQNTLAFLWFALLTNIAKKNI